MNYDYWRMIQAADTGEMEQFGLPCQVRTVLCGYNDSITTCQTCHQSCRYSPIAVYYKLKKVCKTEILRKLKKHFGGKPFATSVSELADERRSSYAVCFTQQSIFC